MGPRQLDAFPLPATAMLELAHPLSIREEYKLYASMGTSAGWGWGPLAYPKRGRVSVCGDNLGQALNTSRNVFKTQQVLQARAEDLTAVVF